MCNRTAVHNQLCSMFSGSMVWRPQNSYNLLSGGCNRNRSCCPDRVGFLSGGRRGASLEDREDCFGRAQSLTRAIRHTYIVSPIDMAGMIGMAQTLAVYHYGYHTLKNRLVQYHEPAREPRMQKLSSSGT